MGGRLVGDIHWIPTTMDGGISVYFIILNSKYLKIEMLHFLSPLSCILAEKGKNTTESLPTQHLSHQLSMLYIFYTILFSPKLSARKFILFVPF